MNFKTPNVILVVLIAAVLLASAWLLGKRHGARQALAIAEQKMSSVEAQAMIDQLQNSQRQTEQLLTEAELAAQVSLARSQTLQKQLDEQMRDNLSNSSDLALYRKIETSQNARAIDVESLEWSRSQPATLELTLVQWQGRDRVEGELQLSFIYSGDHTFANSPNAHADSAEKVDPAATNADLLSDEAQGGSLTVDLEPLNFDFRFFETFRFAMPSEIDPAQAGKTLIPLPDSVEVRITPVDNRIKALKKQIKWIDIAE